MPPPSVPTAERRNRRQRQRAALARFILGRSKPEVEEFGWELHGRELAIPFNRDSAGRQARAQSINIGPSGAYLQPEEFESELEIALTVFSPLRDAGSVVTLDTGRPRAHPTLNDSSTEAVIVAEDTQPTNTDDSFGQIRWIFQKFHSGFIKLSHELIEDGFFDLLDWLKTALVQRVSRGCNRYFTAQLLQQATLGATAASATAIGLNDVLGLKYSLNAAFRMLPTCAFMCHPNIVQTLRELADGVGRPLLRPKNEPGGTDMLDGHPVIYNIHMPSAITASAQTLVFGDMSRYGIRETKMRFVRLEERYADSDQEALAAVIRTDGNVLDAGTHPLVYLQQHS